MFLLVATSLQAGMNGLQGEKCHARLHGTECKAPTFVCRVKAVGLVFLLVATSLKAGNEWLAR